ARRRAIVGLHDKPSWPVLKQRDGQRGRGGQFGEAIGKASGSSERAWGEADFKERHGRRWSTSARCAQSPTLAAASPNGAARSGGRDGAMGRARSRGGRPPRRCTEPVLRRSAARA